MASAREVVKTSGPTLVEEMKLLEELQAGSCGRKAINSELWHACAGPLVTLPQPGSLVYYFPQGHSEQVTASTRRMANSHIPSYPSLPSQMMCQVHNVTLHADKETDEIYAQMTLQLVNSEKDVFPIPDFGLTKSKQPAEFFCKTLTASDTSTHGGFSVPRRAAEKLFPQLDYSMQPPNQELVVRDLHDNSWTFRHIYRGQPKRHLLTTGWSVFVGAKRLKAGDSVLFIRGERSQLMMGVRRANRQQAMLPSSVLSADSMHIGVLAAAAHAAANRSQFTIFYNPRACPSQFVVPLANYHKAAYGTQVFIGMRFGMMFETEDSNKRRYMGTISGISDFDPLRWPDSKWRNLQVEWDENGCVERPARVSLWEIKTPDNLFAFPSPAPSMKRPYPGLLGWENMTRKTFLGIPGNRSGSDLYPASPSLDSLDLVKTLLESQNFIHSAQPGCQQSIYSSILRNLIKDEFPVASSTAPACIRVGNQARQESSCQSEKQQNSTSLFLQQNKYPLQNLMREDQYANHFSEKHKSVNPELDSQLHTSQEGISEGSPSASAVTDQCQNDLFEKKSNISGSKNIWGRDDDEPLETSVTTTNQLKEFSQVTISLGKQGEENLTMTNCLNTEDCPSFTNQGPPLMVEGQFQLVQSQPYEANIVEPAQQDTMPTDTSELHCLPCQKDHYSTRYMDVLDWMPSPAGCPSCSQEPTSPESLSNYSKEDSVLLHWSENPGSAADISAVVNKKSLTHVPRDQDMCISKTRKAHCPPILAHELLSNELPNCMGNVPLLGEQSPCHLEQFALGMPPSEGHNVSLLKEVTAFQNFSNSHGSKNFGESRNPNDHNSCFRFENCSSIIDPSVSSTSQEELSTAWNSGLSFPSSGMVYNFKSCVDVQSQITTASFSEFSLQEFPDSSGNTSSSNIDLGENSLINQGSQKQLSSLRTYTKVQKLGSVGRSINITQFSNYDELKSAIASMFGLEGQLDDPRGLAWKLVYMDYENDVLLVGDDPWEEFINCVRCIKILSPSDVQQMSHKDMDLSKDPNAFQVD